MPQVILLVEGYSVALRTAPSSTSPPPTPPTLGTSCGSTQRRAHLHITIHTAKGAPPLPPGGPCMFPYSPGRALHVPRQPRTGPTCSPTAPGGPYMFPDSPHHVPQQSARSTLSQQQPLGPWGLACCGVACCLRGTHGAQPLLLHTALHATRTEHRASGVFHRPRAHGEKPHVFMPIGQACFFIF